MKHKWIILIVVALPFLFGSCASVKQHQKVYINDKDMKLSKEQIAQFEANFQSYREAASGANGGKTGGGCGCN